MTSQDNKAPGTATPEAGVGVLLDSLAEVPQRLERLFRLVPRERWNWEPPDWEAIPGERFSAIGQVCHVRDIEIDGYHLRIRRMLDEHMPDLASIDSYEIARDRAYGQAEPARALAAFGAARAETVSLLRRLTPEQLERRGTFAEYGGISLRGLIHILCSHDQQHLACMHWLLGRMASDTTRRP